MPNEYITPLLNENKNKIVMLILDGLGGLPMSSIGKTELESANTPNMDQLAKDGILGRTIPIRTGITPGSGPAHLALFGYDPLTYDVGRGVLSAFGVGIEVRPGDVAARGNFCTLDEDGNILDRRAGRIGHEEVRPILEKLKNIKLPGIEVEIAIVMDYRFTIVIRGESLNHQIYDTDPQKTGVPPLPVQAKDLSSERAAEFIQLWVDQAQEILKNEKRANGLTLRGFATNPMLPSYSEAYGLKAACVAAYPMYRGVAKAVGMDIIQFKGHSPEDEFAAVAEYWEEYDFFFVHIKKTDSMGEDGNFEGKVKIIEGVDQALPHLLKLNPDVLIITGDHSTPAKMKAHSWHPVPLLLSCPELAIPDTNNSFGERSCMKGGLGTIQATELMSIALAHANRLSKYGA